MPVRVEDIAVNVRPVSPESKTMAVLGLFLSDPSLFAIPVVSQGDVLGYVTRAGLTEALAAPNGKEQCSRLPITSLMSENPPLVEHGTAAALVAKLAADENTAALTDTVVVLKDGEYFGLISPSALLTAVAHENAARAKAMKTASQKYQSVKARVQESAKEKSKFLAFLSHEIRTPLTGILGVADLLQDSVGGGEPKRLARTISESGTHLDRLLGDLLDLSRLEAGKLPVTPAPFDVRDFALEARDLWQSRIAGKRLDLRISVHKACERRIEADAMRIRQILFNLMSNALKFTEKGYVRVALSTENTGGSLKLKMTVADTGCGISAEDKARMFEAFEQARPTTAQTHGGSGLGLSIAKGLTARLGGEISLADNPGGGSAFTVVLPVLRAGPRLATTTETPAKRQRSLQLGRLLLAEDHAITALVMSRALTAAGWEVETVTTAEAAIARAMTEPFQAILTDIHMPGNSGESVVQTLRRSTGPNQLAPILAVTADVSPERRAACDRAGFSHLIEKPIRPRALVATLADVLMTGGKSGAAVTSRLPKTA